MQFKSDAYRILLTVWASGNVVAEKKTEKSAGFIANFGATDAAILDIVFGKASPQGQLPFELPSSIEAVRNQKEDVPYDSKNPLYKFGFGLSY